MLGAYLVALLWYDAPAGLVSAVESGKVGDGDTNAIERSGISQTAARRF
jgi:hypothetical protein